MARRRQTRMTRRGQALLGVAAALALVLVLPTMGVADARAITVVGPADGAVLGGDAADELILGVVATGGLEGLEVRLDGEDLTPELEDGLTRAGEGELAEGEHHLEVREARGFPLLDRVRERSFTVDRTPPALEVARPEGTVALDQPVTLRGRAGEHAALVIDGRPIAAGEDGTFAVDLPAPPAGAVEVVARDEHGNEASQAVSWDLTLPGAVGEEPIRGVHVSAYAWASAPLREGVLALIEANRINTVEIDLKDEAGLVGYASEVPLAQEIGATRELYDLDEVVRDLHERGVRVVGRLVNFRDPLFADWAVAEGRRELLVQLPDGRRSTQYGGYANIAHPVAWQYNIDLAVEASRAGVDDILLDYVRRPDGPRDEQVYEGMEGSAVDAVAGFVDATAEAVHDAGGRLGVSVFGVSLDDPEAVAQDIDRFAESVDFVSPMVYPSHWEAGSYGVAAPAQQPYDIVFAALEATNRAVEGSGVQVIPWLQDFSLTDRAYGPGEVRAQIRAARDAGAAGFLLWDAKVTYTTEALDPGGLPPGPPPGEVDGDGVPVVPEGAGPGEVTTVPGLRGAAPPGGAGDDGGAPPGAVEVPGLAGAPAPAGTPPPPAEEAASEPAG